MGNRANFVIVANGDWQLYYSHWAGCRMLDALIAGPDYALRYVRSLRQCTKSEWIDSSWADGGAVVDLDRQRMLFFGDSLMVGMNERRAMIQVLLKLWPAYDVIWAYDGTIELAEYVGAQLRDDLWDRQVHIELSRKRDRLCHLVSVANEDGDIRLWPLHWDQSKAWPGPKLLTLLPGIGRTKLSLDVIPEGGVHIDIGRKSVGVWHTNDRMGIFQALPEVWRGWQTRVWNDRFEEQLHHCEGSLKLPAVDLRTGVDNACAWLERRVFESFADSPGGRIVELARLLAPLGPGLRVSDEAVCAAMRPSDGEWAHFVAACDAVRMGA